MKRVMLAMGLAVCNMQASINSGFVDTYAQEVIDFIEELLMLKDAEEIVESFWEPRDYVFPQTKEDIIKSFALAARLAEVERSTAIFADKQLTAKLDELKVCIGHDSNNVPSAWIERFHHAESFKELAMVVVAKYKK